MSGNVLRKDSDGSDCDPFYYKTTLGTLTVPSDPSSEGAMTFDGTSINHVVKGTELSTTDFGVANTLCVNAFAMVPWFYGTTGLCSFNIPSIGGGSQSVYAPASAPVPLLHQNMLTNAEALNLANGVTDTTADVCGADAVQYLSPYYYQNSHELYLR